MPLVAIGRQMAIKNSFSNIFYLSSSIALTFSIAVSGVILVTPSTLAKSEDPDGMSHNAGFRLGLELHCLLNEK